MPIIKSAKKKLKQDRKKTVLNKAQEVAFKKALKSVDKNVSTKKKVVLSKVFSLIDKAVTKKLLHKNKAARLKSKYTRLIEKKLKTDK